MINDHKTKRHSYRAPLATNASTLFSSIWRACSKYLSALLMSPLLNSSIPLAVLQKKPSLLTISKGKSQCLYIIVWLTIPLTILPIASFLIRRSIRLLDSQVYNKQEPHKMNICDNSVKKNICDENIYRKTTERWCALFKCLRFCSMQVLNVIELLTTRTGKFASVLSKRFQSNLWKLLNNEHEDCLVSTPRISSNVSMLRVLFRPTWVSKCSK